MPIQCHPYPKRDQDDNGHHEPGENAVVHFSLAFKPSATRRRTAQGRVTGGSCFLAQLSIALISSSCRRTPTRVPVAEGSSPRVNSNLGRNGGPAGSCWRAFSLADAD